jgi:SAM-dependent methyltransferase
MSYRELLLGCGNNREKRISVKDKPNEWQSLTTLDWDIDCKPDVRHDLNVLPYPFEDNEFDEIHAYQCLEHVGKQGDAWFFFSQFFEFWRILKPGGLFFAMVPMWDSPWGYGDPSHTRVIPKESLVFLDRNAYEQIGRTSMTDFRRIWKGDFETLHVEEGEHEMGFILKAKKDGAR